MEPICPPEKPTLFTEAERDEIKAIFHEAITEYFKSYGAGSRSFIIGTAVILGSLTVIFGSIKTILAWIGFTYISR